MNTRDSLYTLEQRVRLGSSEAKAELRRRLLPAMVQIVERFLQAGIARHGD